MKERILAWEGCSNIRDIIGVVPDEMLADYELCPDPERGELLARQHSSVRETILSTLEVLDAGSFLRMGGENPVILPTHRARGEGIAHMRNRVLEDNWPR